MERLVGGCRGRVKGVPSTPPTEPATDWVSLPRTTKQNSAWEAPHPSCIAEAVCVCVSMCVGELSV